MEEQFLQSFTEFSPVCPDFQAKTWEQAKEPNNFSDFGKVHRAYMKPLELEDLMRVFSQIAPPSTQITLMTGAGGMKMFNDAFKEIFEKEVEKFGNTE